MAGKKILLGLAALTMGLCAATSNASPYLIPGLTVDAHQTYYSSSNGTLAPAIDIRPLISGGVTQLIFSFAGGVVTDGSMRLASPDGLYSDGTAPYNFFRTTFGGAYAGVPIGATTGIDPALMGVFFDPTFAGPPLESLDYRSFAAPDHRTDAAYSPAVNQPFWIGDGFTGNNAYGHPVTGIQQIYNIPAGAQFLLLGIGADVNMADNENGAVGPTSFTPAIPEPETYAMLMAGLGLLGFLGRRRKQVDAASV